MVAISLDVVGSILAAFHDRDAALADGVMAVGLALLLLGAVQGLWSGVAGGAGLMFLGLEVHYFIVRSRREPVAGDLPERNVG